MNLAQKYFDYFKIKNGPSYLAHFSIYLSQI